MAPVRVPLPHNFKEHEPTSCPCRGDAHANSTMRRDRSLDGPFRRRRTRSPQSSRMNRLQRWPLAVGRLADCESNSAAASCHCPLVGREQAESGRKRERITRATTTDSRRQADKTETSWLLLTRWPVAESSTSSWSLQRRRLEVEV